MWLNMSLREVYEVRLTHEHLLGQATNRVGLDADFGPAAATLHNGVALEEPHGPGSRHIAQEFVLLGVRPAGGAQQVAGEGDGEDTARLALTRRPAPC